MRNGPVKAVKNHLNNSLDLWCKHPNSSVPMVMERGELFSMFLFQSPRFSPLHLFLSGVKAMVSFFLIAAIVLNSISIAFLAVAWVHYAKLCAELQRQKELLQTLIDEAEVSGYLDGAWQQELKSIKERARLLSRNLEALKGVD